MPWPTYGRQMQRYLGVMGEEIVHDLLNEQPECNALAVIAAKKGERFNPDNLAFALSLGYRACPHCLPDYALSEDEIINEAEDEAADEKPAAGDNNPDKTQT